MNVKRGTSTKIKILAVADLHGRRDAIRSLQEAAQGHRPDVIVLAGDITTFGSKADVREIMDSLPGLVLAIPGNMDGPATLEAIRESRARDLTTEAVEVSGVLFSGQPGRQDTCDVLVIHEPPKGILDDVGGGRHIGEARHLAAVKRIRPRLVLCGHVHESPGIARVGETTVVNCTVGSGGRGALIEIEGDEFRPRLL